MHKVEAAWALLVEEGRATHDGTPLEPTVVGVIARGMRQHLLKFLAASGVNSASGASGRRRSSSAAGAPHGLHIKP